MTENEISNKVIGIAIELYKKLGQGLLESVYENALAYDLKEAGLRVLQHSNAIHVQRNKNGYWL
jgi:GxxExxY protein